MIRHVAAQLETDSMGIADRPRYHPAAALACAAALFLPAACWTNPLWLGALLASALAAIAVSAGPAASGRALAAALPLAAAFAAVNALISRTGETVLFHLPPLPLAGPIPILLEPVVFGIASGLRIALAVASFSLAESLADADDAFSLCSRFAPKTALATALTVLAIPRMRRDLDRIRGVMRVRGAAIDARGARARAAAARPILGALLSSSIEGAWDTAVALHTRGFGSGSRAAPPLPPWRPRDIILAGGACISLAATVIGLAAGRGVYACHPRLGPLARPGDMAALCAAAGPFLAGVALSRRASR